MPCPGSRASPPRCPSTAWISHRPRLRPRPLRPPHRGPRAPAPAVHQRRHRRAPLRGAAALVPRGARPRRAQRPVHRGGHRAVGAGRPRRVAARRPRARDVDAILYVNTTGLATPSIDARLARRPGPAAGRAPPAALGPGLRGRGGRTGARGGPTRGVVRRPGPAGRHRTVRPDLHARRREQVQPGGLRPVRRWWVPPRWCAATPAAATPACPSSAPAAASTPTAWASWAGPCCRRACRWSSSGASLTS